MTGEIYGCECCDTYEEQDEFEDFEALDGCDCYMCEAVRAAEYCGCGDPASHYEEPDEVVGCPYGDPDCECYLEEELDERCWGCDLSFDECECYEDDEFYGCDCELCQPELYEDADDDPFVLYEEGPPSADTETVAERFKRRYPNILRPGVSERLGDLGKRVSEAGSVTIDFGTPEAPEGYEWVLLPERPGGAPAPGETGQYSSLNPEPIQIEEAWGLNFAEGSALKYLARYPRKGGIEDLEKVKFYCDRLIAREIREGRA